MNVKILVAAHKPYWMPGDDVYLPIQAGAEGKETICGYIPDNTGDNISAKNSSYCELTALYWAWKNLDADYIGLCHYRRYFTWKEARGIPEKRKEILTGANWRQMLVGPDIVLPTKREYFIETIRSHYNHSHHRIGLDTAEEIIAEKYPGYLPYFKAAMGKNSAHMFNMFVMRRDILDAYCSWLFDLLGELDNRLDTTGWDAYEKRVDGFVGELLLDVRIEMNHRHYAELNVSFMEKQNWLKKGGLFLLRKIRGDKE